MPSVKKKCYLDVDAEDLFIKPIQTKDRDDSINRSNSSISMVIIEESGGLDPHDPLRYPGSFENNLIAVLSDSENGEDDNNEYNNNEYNENKQNNSILVNNLLNIIRNSLLSEILKYELTQEILSTYSSNSNSNSNSDNDEKINVSKQKQETGENLYTIPRCKKIL